MVRDRGHVGFSALLVLALCIGLLASCGGDDDKKDDASETSDGGGQPSNTDVPTTEGDPVDGGSLVVGVAEDATGWSPLTDRLGPGPSLAASSMFETLAVLDADSVAQPWLANEWTPNDDFTEWTVTLREDVVFHDGTAFNADVAKQNLDAVLASVLTGLAVGPMIEGATVIDDYTIRYDLKQPWSSFPSSFLAGQPAWQLAPSMIEAGAEGSANPVGTGPFVFDSWTPDNSLELVRNDSYWREGEPHLDTLEFRTIPDDGARTASLQAGDIDMQFTQSAEDANRLDDDYTVIRDWDSEAMNLTINTRESVDGVPNPMSNIHARRAASYATNPEGIAAVLGDGLEPPIGPFSESSPWYDAAVGDTLHAFDVDKAKEEIELYKQDTGESELAVTVLAPTENVSLTVLQALQQQWEDAGINLSIESVEGADFSIRPVTGKFQMVYAPIYNAPEADQNHIFWTGDNINPEGEISLNFTGFANDVTDGALTEARATADDAERKANYTELVQQLNEQAVDLWLFFTPYSLIAADRVHGLQTANELPFGNFWPKNWWGEVWVS